MVVLALVQQRLDCRVEQGILYLFGFIGVGRGWMRDELNMVNPEGFRSAVLAMSADQSRVQVCNQITGRASTD